MQDVLYIEEVEQAATLLKPRRLDILKQLAEPRSCVDLAEVFQETPQKIYYHVKALEGAGLVDKVSERRVRGLMEGFYQAKARAYWLAPGLVGRVGGRQRAQEQMSLGFLMNLAEQLQADVGHLAQSERQNIPSLGLSAQIVLRDARERTAFAQELQGAFQALATKYGRRESDPQPTEQSQTFRLMLACYPTLPPEDDTQKPTSS